MAMINYVITTHFNISRTPVKLKKRTLFYISHLIFLLNFSLCPSNPMPAHRFQSLKCLQG